MGASASIPATSEGEVFAKLKAEYEVRSRNSKNYMAVIDTKMLSVRTNTCPHTNVRTNAG